MCLRFLAKGLVVRDLRFRIIGLVGGFYPIVDKVMCFLGWHDWIIEKGKDAETGEDYTHRCWLCDKRTERTLDEN